MSGARQLTEQQGRSGLASGHVEARLKEPPIKPETGAEGQLLEHAFLSQPHIFVKLGFFSHTSTIPGSFGKFHCFILC